MNRTKYRLYLGPEPKNGGPHPGFRGHLWLAVEGMWCPSGTEWLYVHLNGDDCTWMPIDRLTLIPWHRIHSIEVMS